MSETILDTQGTLCPIPVIKTQQAIKKLAPKDHLKVLASDPGTLHDIPAWCRVHGHSLVSSEHLDSRIEIVIEVGEQSDSVW